MENVWFIADLHFNHKNIIKYCNRPFMTVEEMNEALIKNWNSVVKDEDIVFMLGDFAFASRTNIIEISKKLNGKKTIVLGNHDRIGPQFYYDGGFEFVNKYPIIYKEVFILSHSPMFMQEDGIYINIYGHVHDNPVYPNYTKESFCVSAERINYTPINFKDIISKLKNLRGDNDGTET